MRRQTAYPSTCNSPPGFTLVEVLITLVIIAIVAGLSAPAILSMAPNMTLKSTAQDLYSTLQKAKVSAIKENRDITVRFNSPGFFYIDEDNNAAYTAGEHRILLDEDFNQNNALDAGEDVNGNGRLDTKYGIQLWRNPPGGNCGAAASDWNAAAFVQKDAITFSSRGTSQNDASIYIENKNQDICYAVTTLVAGAVRTRKFNGAIWE